MPNSERLLSISKYDFTFPPKERTHTHSSKISNSSRILYIVQYMQESARFSISRRSTILAPAAGRRRVFLFFIFYYYGGL